MKNCFLFSLLFIMGMLFSNCSQMEDTFREPSDLDAGSIRPKSMVFELQPANNPYDIRVFSLAGPQWGGNGTNTFFGIAGATWGGTPGKMRGLIKFDLSRLYPTDKIKEAKLYMYSYYSPLPNMFSPSNQGSNNKFFIQRIIQPWSPDVDWNNQPATTTALQATVPHTSQQNLDIVADVTSIVKQMVENSQNYGFMLKLENETPYTVRQFYSSFYTDPTKRPKLVIILE